MTGVLSSQCLLITEGVGTKRIPRCHSSGQSCPGESGPIPRRAFRRAWEWDLTSRDNSVPKKWQRGILFLTRNYQTIAKN